VITPTNVPAPVSWPDATVKNERSTSMGARLLRILTSFLTLLTVIDYFNENSTSGGLPLSNEIVNRA
jgi:hypothetical protein